MTLRGTGVLRREDPALLTGQGKFVADLDLPGAAHVTFVTSPFAHALIRSIDTSEAAVAPGVLAIVTAAEVDIGPYPVINPAFNEAMSRSLLAEDRVRYVGEPIVAVVTEDAYQGEDAAELVVVDFEPLQAVVDLESSLDSDVTLFDGPDGNLVVHMDAPGLVADFEACEVTVSQRVVNGRLAPSPLETRVAAAEWDDGGRLVHHNAGQGVHPVRAILAKIYDMEPETIRVISREVGGSFGAKSRPHVEECLLGLLAKRVGRPVRWNPPRSLDMINLGHGRGQIQTITIGGDRDGKIKAYKVHVLQEAGAYPMIGAGLPGNTRVMLTGCYDIPTAEFSSDSAVTNTTPTTAYRGAGRPEAAAAIERAVDLFAREIDMDPAEVRRKNFWAPEQFPLETLTGTPYDSGEYEAALDKALEASGYEELRSEQQRRRESGDVRQLGIGLASYVERTAGVMGSEYGSVQLRPDGTVLARTGSTPYGQGHHTAWSMLISDRTGIPMDRIEVIHGDTDLIPKGSVTGGSRSVQIAGQAMWNASGQLVDQAKKLAAQLLEANEDDVILDTEAGAFHVVGTPAIAVDWDQLAQRLVAEPDVELFAMDDYANIGPTFPFGTHVAVVEVDTETGHVSLERLVAVDDAGIILNPLLADGQVHGGLAQGAAQALLEEFRYDEDGNPITGNFADYAIISAAELPSFERVMMETPTHINELGAKGIGESGTVGATPAVQNAVVDALAHLGVSHVDMPTTPERVWRAINDASAQ